MSSNILAIQVERHILLLRRQRVMLDFHLAELYAVETRELGFHTILPPKPLKK
jgi:hypothetical protein